MDSYRLQVQMSRYEVKEHRALLKEARRPEEVKRLNSDPVAVERLQSAMDEAHRFTWPSSLEFNL